MNHQLHETIPKFIHKWGEVGLPIHFQLNPTMNHQKYNSCLTGDNQLFGQISYSHPSAWSTLKEVAKQRNTIFEH